MRSSAYAFNRKGDGVVEVVATEEFGAWYQSLEVVDAERVVFVVALLRERGVALGHPYSSALKGSKVALRELRAAAGRGPLRILYAFDPERRAVLLLGGDKSGDSAFYETMIPKAEALWMEHLAAVAAAATKTIEKKGKKR
ncbi:MAG: type II toxin-antitoxin system RelE/ParE family toxin [Archangium sp.]